jgi:hypothetical protein
MLDNGAAHVSGASIRRRADLVARPEVDRSRTAGESREIEGGPVIHAETARRRRFVHAHHVVWWSRGGRTDLDNLTLVCSFHHKMVHEYGWAVRLRCGVTPRYRPDGTQHRARPSPPREPVAG